MRCVYGDYFRLNYLLAILLNLFVSTAYTSVNSGFHLSHQERIFKSYSIKEACIKYFDEAPLLAGIESRDINCMGKVFNPKTLCKGDTLVDSSFTRAVISEDKANIICEFASMVKINLSCSHPLIKSTCKKSSLNACQSLQKNYAHDLKLIHSAKIGLGDKEMVDCHFSRELF